MEGAKNLHISEAEAKRLYKEAGTPIQKCEKQFEASEKVLIDTLFMKHVQSVTSRLKLPFELQQFQLQAAAVLYQDKSCILVARVPKGWN